MYSHRHSLTNASHTQTLCVVNCVEKCMLMIDRVEKQEAPKHMIASTWTTVILVHRRQ